MQNIFVVLPAYNEAQNISSLLSKWKNLQLTHHRIKIVLVDDGSTDNSAQIADSLKNQLQLDLQIHRHPKNLGLGAALRSGLQIALQSASKNDWVLTMDADDTHDPHLLHQMILQTHNPFDVVIASRYQIGSQEIGLSYKRKCLSWICNQLLQLVFAIPNVKDYTCGFRLMKVKRLQTVAKATQSQFYKTEGFVCMSELLINLNIAGARCSEVPLILRYDLKKGNSKMNISLAIRQYLSLLIRK